MRIRTFLYALKTPTFLFYIKALCKLGGQFLWYMKGIPRPRRRFALMRASLPRKKTVVLLSRSRGSRSIASVPRPQGLPLATLQRTVPCGLRHAAAGSKLRFGSCGRCCLFGGSRCLFSALVLLGSALVRAVRGLAVLVLFCSVFVVLGRVLCGLFVSVVLAFLLRGFSCLLLVFVVSRFFVVSSSVGAGRLLSSFLLRGCVFWLSLVLSLVFSVVCVLRVVSCRGRPVRPSLRLRPRFAGGFLFREGKGREFILPSLN
jgi:hypothetical protein